MLIELFGSNFGCFRDEFRLSMLATDIDPDSDRGIICVEVEGDDEPLRLLRAVALYGANASGKSTLLRAAGAISRFLAVTPRLASDSPLRPYMPFALGKESEKPVTVGAKAVIAGGVYEYSFSHDHAAFLTERLVRLQADGAYETLFARDRQHVSGSWTEDAQFKLISTEFRPNALLLALADSLAPSLAKGVAVGLRMLLDHSDPTSNLPLAAAYGASDVAELVRENPKFEAWLGDRLRIADVGVIGLRARPRKRQLKGWLMREVLLQQLRDEGIDLGMPSRRGGRSSHRLELLHESESGPVALPYHQESLGTQRIVEWAPLFYDLTHSDNPRAAFADELDASMHPHLLQALVRHFNCEVPAEHVRGQLIFTTHETALLDDEAKDAVLRRDQIYLTEKDSSGASRLFSVAEFKERNNLNLRRRYLQGRYGALPSIETHSE